MVRSVQVSIDHDKCVGSSVCSFICPEFYHLNRNCQSTILHPDANVAGSVVEAARSCPAAAITVMDAQTGKRLCPLPETRLN